MLHILKTVDPHFEDQWQGIKLFELRLADRNYQPGDYLLSRQYDPEGDQYSGRQILYHVPHLLSKEAIEEFVGAKIPTRRFVLLSTAMLWKTTLSDGQAAVDLARETIDEIEREGAAK